tara:strand:- start:18 stop:269 length:252 start_codon:yes stop_codon:yes gene_type:complete
MKVIILIMFLCSATSNTCLAPYQWSGTFKDPYDCMLKGYEVALKKTQKIGRTDINKDRIFIKFKCLEKAIIIPKEKPKPGINL